LINAGTDDTAWAGCRTSVATADGFAAAGFAAVAVDEAVDLPAWGDDCGFAIDFDTLLRMTISL
jgi:hypothetical protein